VNVLGLEVPIPRPKDVKPDSHKPRWLEPNNYKPRWLGLEGAKRELSPNPRIDSRLVGGGRVIQNLFPIVPIG